ncbi:MAG: hypothetical protein R8M11_00265 [Gallionella sp.]
MELQLQRAAYDVSINLALVNIFDSRLYPLRISFLSLCLAFIPLNSWAAGTTAGFTITNSATLSYSIGAIVEPPITSLPASFQVDELIQPVLTWQDASAVPVNTPSTNEALTFLLTNAGNGQEAFSLARTNGPLPLPAGNYTPLDGTIGSLFMENNAQPGFQPSGPNADTVYVLGVNDPDLAPDAGLIIYVISNTPTVPDNSQGDVLLTVASLTAGAAGALPGTGLLGLGQGGSDAVVGSSNAQSSATGSYIATGLNLLVNKTVISTLDPNGGSVAMPGAVITYQIIADLTGSGIAANLVLTDPLPAETTYVPGSITVDGATRTDASDADNAQFIANTISVSLGDVISPREVTVTFRATIN